MKTTRFRTGAGRGPNGAVARSAGRGLPLTLAEFLDYHFLALDHFGGKSRKFEPLLASPLRK